jgi:ubiquinone/menaquinone biosynthesis C-methylase UbiE
LNNIEKAKQGFEKSFAERNFYDRQTKDDKHLDTILNALEIKKGDRILDFGTGSGYLAFAISKKYSECSIVGLDIVSGALKRNRIFASEQGIENLEFVEYDGIMLPFENHVFDWVITRYALHHVPDIQYTFDEISRVLKSGGTFFVSDPTPNQLDTGKFVDSFMQLQDDGHNRFYTLDEFSECAIVSKMKLEKYYLTVVRFPRKADETYVDLLNKTDVNIKNAYGIEIVGDECFIVEDVLNMVFKKQ